MSDMDTKFNREPLSRRQTVQRIVQRLAVLSVTLVLSAPGALWGLGQIRRYNDRAWCNRNTFVDQDCVSRRESRRWGPFLAFGQEAHHSSD